MKRLHLLGFALKWPTAALALALAVLWAASIFKGHIWMRGGTVWGWWEGNVFFPQRVQSVFTRTRQDWGTDEPVRTLPWGDSVEWSSGRPAISMLPIAAPYPSGTAVRGVPVWMMLLPASIATIWLFRRFPFIRRGHCRCGYSLAGLAAGAACPECGAKP